MRIPWYYCVLICLLSVGVTYWLGARHYDFVTPPQNIPTYSKEPLVEVERDENSQAEEEIKPDEQETVGVNQEKKIELDAYTERLGIGADAFVELAESFIQSNKQLESLVAWERVLDSSEPTAEQVKKAFEILKLHKVIAPPEKLPPSAVVKLHASVPADMHEKMKKILNVSAALMKEGSAYHIDVIPEVSIIMVKKGKKRPPVSVWMSAKNETARGTFRTRHANELGLSEKVNRTIFNIVGPYLEEHSKLKPLQKMHPEISAQDTLSYLITRHSWSEFGRLLNVELTDVPEE